MAIVSGCIARQEMLEGDGETLPIGVRQMVLMRERSARRRFLRQPIEIVGDGQELLAALPQIGLECVEEIAVADLGEIIEELRYALQEIPDVREPLRPAWRSGRLGKQPARGRDDGFR